MAIVNGYTEIANLLSTHMSIKVADIDDDQVSILSDDFVQMRPHSLL